MWAGLLERAGRVHAIAVEQNARLFVDVAIPTKHIAERKGRKGRKGHFFLHASQHACITKST